jgi:hypothetical protein
VRDDDLSIVYDNLTSPATAIRLCTVRSRSETRIKELEFKSTSKPRKKYWSSEDGTQLKSDNTTTPECTYELKRNSICYTTERTSEATQEVIRESKLDPGIAGIKSEILAINTMELQSVRSLPTRTLNKKTVDPVLSTGEQGGFVATGSDQHVQETLLRESTRPATKHEKCMCRKCDQVYLVDPVYRESRKSLPYTSIWAKWVVSPYWSE